MKGKTNWIFGFIIIFLSISLSGLSQVKLKGELSGIVVDENGEPLPTVSITLTGEKMFRKSLSAVSNEKGLFRFLNLNPGIYELELALQGFNPLRLTNTEISVGRTTPIRAVLTPLKLEKEIAVVAQAPLIETQTTQLSTNFTNVTVENVPTSRNIMDLMGATPGVNDKGAFGAGASYDLNAYEAGTDLMYAQGSITSTVRLNGVDVSNSDVGNTLVNPNYDTIEEVQVVGIGASAEYGNFTGAVMNIVTKSGGNKYHGGLSFYYSDDHLRGDNSSGIIDLKPSEIKYQPETTAYLGGSLIKEKLFFFLAGGYTARKHREFGAPGYDTLKQPHYQLKLDWVATKNNTLTFMVNSDPMNQDNLGLLPGSGHEIAYSRVLRLTTIYGSWQSILSDRTLLELKYAGFKGEFNNDPVSLNASQFWDGSTGKTYGSYGMIVKRNYGRDEIDASLTHYVDDFLKSSHEFKFGLEYERSYSKENRVTTGEGMFWAYPAGSMMLIYGLVNYKVYSDQRVDRISGYAQDNIKVGSKINLNLGLRYDNPALGSGKISGAVVRFPSFSPRIGISYDIGGDAKNVFHLHYGRYRQKLTTYGLSRALPSQMSDWIYYMMWVPAGSFVYSEDNLKKVLAPENYAYTWYGSGAGWPVEKGMNLPYTDVFNVGFEKQVLKNFALSIDYIYKRDGDILVRSTKTKHTYQEIQWTDPYLGNTIPLWLQTDSLPDVWYHANSEWAKRRHHFLTITFRKREVGSWRLMASFTYQNSKGNVDNTEGPVQGLGDRELDTNPNFYLNPLRWGYLSWNRPYQFKLLGTYFLPWGISISGDLRLLSGNYWTPLIYSYIAGLPGLSYDIPLEKMGNRQFPMSKILNLRIAKSFRLSASSRLELMADILNAFNSADGWWYYTQPTSIYPLSQQPSMGKPHYLFPPRNARLGIRLTF